MLKQLQKTKDQKGFTIIEVLIVLAIAGLILLIVFLAVPALQRNSRDTSRRNDVSRVLGAAQEVINNNNGQLTNLDSAALQSAVGTMGYYTSSNVTVSTTAPVSGGSNDTTNDTVVLYKGATCANNKATTTGATTRSLAITYKIESSGGTLQCTNS